MKIETACLAFFINGHRCHPDGLEIDVNSLQLLEAEVNGKIVKRVWLRLGDCPIIDVEPSA